MIDQSSSDGRAGGGGGPESGGSGAGGPPLAPHVLDGIRAVVEPLAEAVLIADSDGKIRLTNDAADRLFAGDPIASASDLLSRFDGVAAQTSGPDGTPASGAATAERPGFSHGTVRPRHQPNTWFVLDRTALGTGADRATVFVLRDVTASAELRGEREAFLDVLSHELRTPLTTIYAGSSVLARRSWLAPPATRTLARDISSEAARLYDLVENLLVIARLERRILQPLDEAVDLGRALDGAIRMMAERFPNARIVPILPATPPAAPLAVRGDATYVEQACRNLILASLGYSDADDASHLTVRVDVDRGRGEVAVRVIDRGPSLAPEEARRAFELPTAASSARLSGAGVGPYVTRQAVEAMGGRTWVDSPSGGGLEIGFALRMDEAAA
jgi:signal transduction histidine kinase